MAILVSQALLRENKKLRWQNVTSVRIELLTPSIWNIRSALRAIEACGSWEI